MAAPRRRGPRWAGGHPRPCGRPRSRLSGATGRPRAAGPLPERANAGKPQPGTDVSVSGLNVVTPTPSEKAAGSVSCSSDPTPFMTERLGVLRTCPHFPPRISVPICQGKSVAEWKEVAPKTQGQLGHRQEVQKTVRACLYQLPPRPARPEHKGPPRVSRQERDPCSGATPWVAS